ncbi:5'/3'-nucleotidase SurE [Acetomicrobium sp.]|uniref:5'/3'-nucleotidase SurE n=1 Tax=Acetomicrobium sp. TaxID=1872099 RepID=UPI002B25CF36|nr:5'/3'-nucleotidase SurE [Acetomicrobium sp.]
MRILVTNDDGVLSRGIIVLATFLQNGGHEVIVVAPERQHSSGGHAITLHRPLRLWQVSNGPYPSGIVVYACNGTPADSVVLGLEELDPSVELVCSGINIGPNLGDDLTYSGTVAAAMEGVVLGRPSVAFSLDCEDEGSANFDTAGMVSVKLVQWLQSHPLGEGLLLNVNIPNKDAKAISGLKVTKKGLRIYEGKVSKLRDPHGRVYYWIAGKPTDQLIEGTDVWAVANGYVSITPVHLDMTHYPSLQKLKNEGLEEVML